jgi:P4 family phage/plasmid primase-like protien
METSTAQTSRQRFDGVVYQAALAFYGLPSYYKRVFTTKAIPCDPYKAAPVWVQMNLPVMNYPLKKAENANIATLQNIQLDFEYPADPGKVHQLGIALADKLVEQGLAESGLPVEDSGAGCHIVIPIVAVDVAAAGGGELVNRAVAEIVNQFIKPEFEALAAKFGLAGLVKLEGFDISRILSAPGTWRPGGSKPNEAAFLAGGYMRRWLAPFDGKNYPARNESEALSALIKAVCISFQAEEASRAAARSKPATPAGSANGKHDISPAEWLSGYYSKKDMTGDRSHDFNSLVWACYLRFDAAAVEASAGLIDELTGGKYGRRAETEALRSLRKAERLPKVNRADWYASRAYQYPTENRVTENKGYVETAATPPIEPPVLPVQTIQEPFKQHHLTDMGNARRLVERFGENIRFVGEWGWLCWDGRRWKIDKTAAAERFAKAAVGTIYAEAGQEEEPERRKEIADWARKSESKAKLDAMLTLAESEIEVRATPEDFDRDPWQLNCLNGTLDLRTGQLRPHNRADKFTRLVQVAYDPDAKAPTWLKFLDRIMASNQGLITYLQRAVGYTMTGLVTEHCLFFLYGSGKNGKSTFAQTLLEMLGDYQIKSPTSMIMIKRNEGIPNDLARLAGVRLTVTAEVEDGQRLAESLIKDLTGGDTITARLLHKEFFDFQPTHKLWMFGNHKPQIRGTDEGIWRRIKLVPFNTFISPEERDLELAQKLRAELPGILAWAIQGCQDWRRDGLTEPAEVVAATQTYRAEMDSLASFLGDCCMQGTNYKVKTSDLYKEYEKWCAANNEFILSARKFSSRMIERGFTSDRGTGGHYQWRGLGLVLDDDDFIKSMTGGE